MESKTEKNTDSSNGIQSKNKTQQAGKSSTYRQGANPDRTKSDKDSGYDSESDFKMQTDKHGDADQMESGSESRPGQDQTRRPSKDSEQNPEQYDPNRDHEDSRDAYLKE